MPRPKSQQELLEASDSNFKKMFELIETFDPQERVSGQIPFEDRDQNIRDILVHLHHWHLMFLDWYKVGMRGDKPDMPAKGYTWKTLPDLNYEIWQRYQQTSYDDAVAMLKKSCKKLRVIICQHNDDELFEKKRYHWTGSTSLGSYIISATSSHYDWAIKKLKRYKKVLKDH